MKGINPRIYSFVLFGLMGISAILFLLFMFSEEPEENASGVLVWCWALLGIATVAAVLFAIIGMIKDPKKARNSLIGVAALVIIFFIGYAMSTDEAYKVGDLIVEGGTSKMSEAGLVTFYAMAAIAVLAIVYTEVSKAFK